MEVTEASDSDKKPSKVTILEDITLGPSSKITIVKPAGSVLVQTELKEGKKINILQRRNQLLMAGHNVSMHNAGQLLPIQSTGQLLSIHKEKINQLLKQRETNTTNTGQTLIVSGSFSNGLYITPPKDVTEKPKEPRVPIIMRKPQLEHGVRPEDVKIFTKHDGPEWYDQHNDMMTDPIITNNLPKAFSDFPIFGIPKNRADLPRFQDQLVQDFVGLSDDQYEKQKIFCSPDLLFTGNEIKMAIPRPTQGSHSSATALRDEERVPIPEDNKLQTLKKLNTRVKLDINHLFARKLKYRGVRLLSLHNQELPEQPEDVAPELAPGQDALFRVRLYRPFTFAKPGMRRRAGAGDGQQFRGRHSVFNCDVLLLGRQPLSALRDRIVCRNDLDLRLDLSDHPNLPVPATSKESFPSNFIFINNVFYIDKRENCRDLTREVRAFAEERGLGRFEVKDMCVVTLAEVNVRLAYPEVYVHQGDCEHLFQFSEIRLLGYSDPLLARSYPCHSAASQNQTLYCSTCAEFAARWIVTSTEKVPFDPGFFCDTCFFSYMYIDGKKVDNFKAYLYKGNEMNVLRPHVEFGMEDALNQARAPTEMVRIDY